MLTVEQKMKLISLVNKVELVAKEVAIYEHMGDNYQVQIKTEWLNEAYADFDTYIQTL